LKLLENHLSDISFLYKKKYIFLKQEPFSLNRGARNQENRRINDENQALL
jgi:hypothetical protein